MQEGPHLDLGRWEEITNDLKHVWAGDTFSTGQEILSYRTSFIPCLHLTEFISVAYSIVLLYCQLNLELLGFI
jgi:hypothetical protein